MIWQCMHGCPNKIEHAAQSIGRHGGGGSGDPKAHRSPTISAEAALRNVDNARAIENGILYMTVIPMFIKFILYGVSHLPPYRTNCTKPPQELDSH